MEKVKLLQLLIDLLNLKDEKMTAIKSQKYQQGAILRDRERILERMIYKELVGCDSYYEEFAYSKYTECIKNYLKSEYNIDYNTSGVYVDTKESIKSIIRDIKLIELGI